MCVRLSENEALIASDISRPNEHVPLELAGLENIFQSFFFIDFPKFGNSKAWNGKLEKVLHEPDSTAQISIFCSDHDSGDLEMYDSS
jgi:hypothetical protein